MSEYYLGFTGAQLDDAINKVRSGYLLPSGNSPVITTNGTHNVKNYENAVVNVPVGITPIGNLTDSLIVRNSSAEQSNASHIATIPAGYYVNSDIVISDWKTGTITGNGTTGGTFKVPYSSIGFIPKWVALIATSSSAKAANSVICFFSSPTSSRYWYFGSSTTSVNTGHDTVYAKMDSTGITFPAISSSTKYAACTYRWFALR
jgi:hypothetical protein